MSFQTLPGSPCWIHWPCRTLLARHRPRHSESIHNQLILIPYCSALALSSNNHQLFFQQFFGRSHHSTKISPRLLCHNLLHQTRLLRTALSNMSQLTSPWHFPRLRCKLGNTHARRLNLSSSRTLCIFLLYWPSPRPFPSENKLSFSTWGRLKAPNNRHSRPWT